MPTVSSTGPCRSTRVSTRPERLRAESPTVETPEPTSGSTVNHDLMEVSPPSPGDREPSDQSNSPDDSPVPESSRHPSKNYTKEELYLRWRVVADALGEKKEELSRRVIINRAPLFSQEEFYCFIRPKLLQYAIDRDDDLLELTSASALLARLRPPLSLATMRKYFLELSKEPDLQVMMTMEENFTKNADLPDSDSWAMNFLGEYFKERLRKIKNY